MPIDYRRPPRYSPQLQGYIDRLRSQFDDLPAPREINPYVPLDAATPADEPGAFERAMAAIGTAMSIPGKPFRALAEQTYREHMLAQSGWTPELGAQGVPQPDTPTLTAGQMAKAAAFDVGEAPATHGEAFLRGATEMVGDIAVDPAAMALIGGGMGALPAGALRTTAHYGLMGMLGHGIVEGGKETYQEYQARGAWTPEVTEKAARPALDAALLLSPYAWNKLKSSRATETPAAPTAEPPRQGPGIRPSDPLDFDLVGAQARIGPERPYDVTPLGPDFPRPDISTPGGLRPAPERAAYASPTARRMGRWETLLMRERMKGSESGRDIEEMLDNYGAEMEKAGWPDPVSELGGAPGIAQLVREGRLPASEAAGLEAAMRDLAAASTRLQALAERGSPADARPLLEQAATAEMALMRTANRLGSRAHLSQTTESPSGKVAQRTLTETIRALEGQREAALQQGNLPAAEALNVRIQGLQRNWLLGERIPTGPPETVRQPLSRLWREIEGAEGVGNAPLAEALRARYEVLERALAQGRGEEVAAQDLAVPTVPPPPAVEGPAGPAGFRAGGPETVQQQANRLWREIEAAQATGDQNLAYELTRRYEALEGALQRGEGDLPAATVQGRQRPPEPPPEPPTEPPAAPSGPRPPPPAPTEPPGAAPEPTEPPREPGEIRAGAPLPPTTGRGPSGAPGAPRGGTLTAAQESRLADLLRGVEERGGAEAKAKASDLATAQAAEIVRARALPVEEGLSARAKITERWERAEADAFDVYGMSTAQLRKLRKQVEATPEEFIPSEAAGGEPSRLALQPTEVRVDIGRGPGGEGFVVRAHGPDGSRDLATFADRATAQAALEPLKVQAEANREAAPQAPSPEPSAPGQVYKSGMSRTSDFLRAATWEAPFGVDVGELSRDGVTQLGTAIARFRGHAFVDSGAFGLFRRNQKLKGVEALDFDKVFERYQGIRDAAGAESGDYERDYHPPIKFVMPDVVGDQDASIEALGKYGDRVHEMVLDPYSEPVIPIQKGVRSLQAQLEESLDAIAVNGRTLGYDAFTIGLPGNAKAVTVGEVGEFVQALEVGEGPLKLHFLGVGQADRLAELSAAVLEHAPNAIITSDANRVRSFLRGEIDRDEAIRLGLELPEGADVTPPDRLPAGVGEVGETPQSILDMEPQQRTGYLKYIDELLEDNPVVTSPQMLYELGEEHGIVMPLDEAAWHLRRWRAKNETPAIEPEEPPRPTLEPEYPDLGPEVNELLSGDQRKALSTALGRIPESTHGEVLATMLRQIRGQNRAEHLKNAIEGTKNVPPARRSAAERKAYTANRAELKALEGVLEAGYESLTGVLRDATEGQKVVRRLRQIAEKKGIAPRERATQVTTPLVSNIIRSISRAAAKDDFEIEQEIAEWAKEQRTVDEYSVLAELEREMEGWESLADEQLKTRFLDEPGYGPKRIREILQAGPEHKEFPKVIDYRTRLAQEMAAVQEYMLSDPEAFEEFIGSDARARYRQELYPIADALAADLIEAPEPQGDRPFAGGPREGEYPDGAEAHLAKTFMWGIRVPGTNQSITTQEAIDAIRQLSGRTFGRIAQAYEEALSAETRVRDEAPAPDEVPFDVTDAPGPDDVMESMGVWEQSMRDRPLDGRYGPAPKRPTPGQIERLGRKFGPVAPIRRPTDEARARSDAERDDPRAGGTTAPERGGRAGVRGAGGPGAGRPAETAEAARPRRGVFGVVLARAEETAAKPANYELVPREHRSTLGEHQKLAVAKAIEHMEAGKGFLLADGTGVGKTHSIFSVAHHFSKKGHPVVIIAPSKTISPRKIDGRWQPTGSYAEAADQLRVRYTFIPSSMREFPLNPANIYISTYHRLADIKVTPETVVIFDEAHYLKNLEKSGRAESGKEIGDKAHSILFATATPGDTADQFLWAERVGILEGKTAAEQMHDLGMIVTKKEVIDPKTQRKITKYYWRPLSEGKTNARIQELFARLTAQGAVLKREIDMSALSVEVREVPLPEEGHAVMRLIEEKFPGGGLKAAVKLGHQRRQQEPYKLEETKRIIKEELAQGRNVVVFAARINRSDVKKKVYGPDGEVVDEELVWTSEGTIKQLQAWLGEQGIDFSAIHGAASEKTDEAIARFQSNERRVVVATVEKGGEGINLDDRTGDRPRTLVMMTAPFSSVEMFQAAGRVHRYTTVTPSKIIMLRSDNKLDKWNFDINASKMANLGARVSGQVDLLRPDLLTEFGAEGGISTELPKAEFSTADIEYALLDLTNWRPSRDIKSIPQRNFFIKKLASLHPKWNEDGELFTIQSLEGDVFHGYFREGSFEIAKDRPTTWGKIGFKKVPAAQAVQEAKMGNLFAPEPEPTEEAEARRLAPGAKKKKGEQTFIEGWKESVMGTPIMTEGNLPGGLFSKEQEAIRERGRQADAPGEPLPTQKGLFGQEQSIRGVGDLYVSRQGKRHNGGHDSSDAEVEAAFDRLFAVGRRLVKVEPMALPGAGWLVPLRVGSGKSPLEPLKGGARVLHSVLAERIVNFEPVNWNSGKYVAKTASDMGAVYSVARHPNIEQASYLIRDAESGRIVRGAMVSSGLPLAVAWGKNKADWVRQLRAALEDARQANGGRPVKLMTGHNHPSGNSEPSGADLKFDRQIREVFGDVYEGGVVINHEEFSTITYEKGTQKVTPYRKSLTEVTEPDPFLREGVDPTDFYRTDNRKFNLANPVPEMRALRTFFRPEELGDDWPMMVTLDATLHVRDVFVVPPNLWRDPEMFRWHVKQWGKESGAAYLVAAIDNPSLTDKLLAESYLKDGSLADAVNITPVGASSMVVKRRLQTRESDIDKLGLIGHRRIPYDIGLGNWRETDDRRMYPPPMRPAAGGGGGAGVPPKGPPPPPGSPFNWPEEFGPGPGDGRWQRRVKFAEKRMAARARGATVTAGADPTMFWDTFIVGADRFSKGLRDFTGWLASMTGPRDILRRIWNGLMKMLKPSVRVTERRADPGPAEPVFERGPRPARVRPIPEPTPRDLEEFIRAVERGEPVDPGTGKPPVEGRGGVPGLDVNINTIVNEGSIHETLTRLVRTLEGKFGRARSYRSWDSAKKMALRMGLNEADVKRLLEQKGALTDYEIIAARLLRQEAGIDFSSKWGEFTELRARWNGEKDNIKKASLEAAMLEAERDAQAAASKLMGITATTVAAGSEAGRALAIHRMMVKELSFEEKLMRKLMRDKAASQDELAQLAQALEAHDMARVDQILRKVYKPTVLDRVLEYWINSILSGPPTQAANITGNTTMQAIQVPERGLAAQLEKFGVRQALEKMLTGEVSPTERIPGEATQMLASLIQTRFGFAQSLRLAWDALWNPNKYSLGAKGEYRPPSIGGLAGDIIRSPSRMMEGADVGAKSSAFAAQVAARSWRRAVGEMQKAGQKWSKEELNQRVDQIQDTVRQYAEIEIRRRMDPKGVSKEERRFLAEHRWAADEVKSAEQFADKMTFRDENTQLTKYWMLIRNRYPWLTFMTPFVRTPERILVQAVRRTPIGLARTIQNIKNGKIKGGEASDRLAQGIIGTLASAGIYMAARDGMITGAGPADPRKRRAWLETGKRPYAVKIGDTWVSFARIEPLATTFGFAADLAEAQDDKVAGDVWDKLHYSVIQNIANKTYLEGMISTAEALGDPDRYGARLYKRMVGAVVPNLFATAARTIDPIYRQNDSIEDTLLARVPWFSTAVPARLTGTGEPATRGEDPLSRFISPFRYAREAGPEKNLERMFLETGYSPSAPPRYMTMPGTMGRKVMLTQAERDLYAAYARRATGFARTLTANRDWNDLDVYMKAEFLRRVYRFAHDAGRKAMYRSVLARVRQGEYEMGGS